MYVCLMYYINTTYKHTIHTIDYNKYISFIIFIQCLYYYVFIQHTNTTYNHTNTTYKHTIQLLYIYYTTIQYIYIYNSHSFHSFKLYTY